MSLEIKLESMLFYPKLEAEGDLMKLVGKGTDDDLTMDDAKKIGQKIAKMSGDRKKKYLGMASALGGYYSGQGSGKKTLDSLRKAIFKAYNTAEGEE